MLSVSVSLPRPRSVFESSRQTGGTRPQPPTQTHELQPTISYLYNQNHQLSSHENTAAELHHLSPSQSKTIRSVNRKPPSVSPASLTLNRPQQAEQIRDGVVLRPLHTPKRLMAAYICTHVTPFTYFSSILASIQSTPSPERTQKNPMAHIQTAHIPTALRTCRKEEGGPDPHSQP